MQMKMWAPEQLEGSLVISKYVNCDDRECKATSTNDMENLVSLEHKVKELFSCKLCDFDSEHGTELKTHDDKIFMT